MINAHKEQQIRPPTERTSKLNLPHSRSLSLHSCTHAQTVHSQAPDVEAAGESLCSWKSTVLSLHETTADGKHKAETGLKLQTSALAQTTWLSVC